VPLNIKPLSEHKADILPIAQHYLEIFIVKYESQVRGFSEEAKKSLVAYRWPGNVRELKNTIERLCVLCDHEVVDLSDIFYYGQNDHSRASVFGFYNRQDDPDRCGKRTYRKSPAPLSLPDQQDGSIPGHRQEDPPYKNA